MVPLHVLMLCAVYACARMCGASWSSATIAWLSLLSFCYLHAPDVRYTCLAVVFALIAIQNHLAQMAPAARDDPRASIPLALAVAATCYSHPMIGSFLVLYFVAQMVIEHRDGGPGARACLPSALSLAAILCTPLGLFYCNLILHSVLAASIVATAIACIAWLIYSAAGRMDRSASWLAAVFDRFGPLLVGLSAALLLTARIDVDGLAPQSFARYAYGNYPVLSVWTACAVILWAVRRLHLIAGAAAIPRTVAEIPAAAIDRLFFATFLSVWLVLVCVQRMPHTEAWTIMRAEFVHKVVAYWLTTLVLIPTAAVVGSLADDLGRRAGAWLDAAVFAVVVALVVAPLSDNARLKAATYDEHHLSQIQAIQLMYAQRGYWCGHPDARDPSLSRAGWWACWDPRHLIGPEQRQVVDAFKGLVRGGEIKRDDYVLHVARSRPQALPLAEFSGIREVLLVDQRIDPVSTTSRVVKIGEPLPQGINIKYILTEEPRAMELASVKREAEPAFQVGTYRIYRPE